MRWPSLVVAALLFAGQAALRPLLQEQQASAGLVLRSEDAEGLAADVAVPMLALGAFRGLLVDYLWLRSFSLREQGRNYESRQLAEQICRLQPRLSDVWSWLAHDLAYNLSSSEPTWEGRWRWIQNGIELLRDQGLRLNPKDPELYFTLSRIYQDKIGGTFDDFHMRFKGKHAQDLVVVLGDPPLGAEALAATPPLATLLSQDAAARALVEDAEAVGFQADLLPWFELRLKQGGQDERLAPFMDRHRGTEAYDRVLRSVRRDQLQELYGLDPRRVLEVDREWGPLDWRGSDAMAIYWAAEGSRVAAEQEDLPDELRLRRVAIQAAKNAMRRGRISVLPNGQVFLAPQVELVGALDQVYQDSIRRAKQLMEALEGAPPEDEHGHREDAPPSEEHHFEQSDYEAASAFLINQEGAREDFLAEAVILLYQYGRETDAKTLLVRARAAYPKNPTFALPYEAFVIQALGQRFADPEMFDTQAGTSQLVEGAWTTAYKMLALGEDERYRSMSRLAAATRERWQRMLASREPADADRLKIPFEAVRRRAVHRAFGALPPALGARLAERVGLTVEQLRQPPPRIDLPEPREGGQ